MQRPIPIRLTIVLLAAGMFLLALPPCVRAQDDPNDAPLGDVARSFRKKIASPEVVIDNDNFSKVVDDAETRRATGSTMVFSLDPGAKNFHVSTPDVSCSFSFSAKTSSLLSDPIILDELPRSELAKLEGPATIDGDSLQVSMHNGTEWELREVVIGLTILRRPSEAAASYGAARIVPAMAGGPAQQAQDSFQKQPDVTVLLRVKGSAAPAATALFRTQLNFALFPEQEWHWAIVRAKGVPPQAPAQLPAEVTAGPIPVPVSEQLAPDSRVAPGQLPSQLSPTSAPDPNAAVH